MTDEVDLFTPKSQKQYDLIWSDTDITFFGGSAGAGKSWNSLLRFLRYVNEPLYRGFVIRKTQASMKQGIFADAVRLFKAWDDRVKVNLNEMTIKFPSGAIIIFKGLDGQAAIDYFQGQEISGALVDEVTQISYEEISWLMTRLRSNASVKPTVWFTGNPNPDHFVRQWIEWYLHPEKTYETLEDGTRHDIGGRPNQERNGMVRWYYVIGGQWYWDTDKDRLTETYKHLLDERQKPMSFRFIGATCLDNPVLLEKQPMYLSNLLNKSVLEVERLYHGNWFVRQDGAGFWKHEWCKILKTFPHPDDPDDQIVERVRCWDLAYTEPHDANPDPDFTVGVLMARTKNGYYIVEHVVRDRLRVGALYRFIAETAKKDYDMYGIIPQVLPEDPASGKATFAFAREYLMSNGIVAVKKVQGSNQRNKLERFKNFAAASENDAVYIRDAEWNNTYFKELEAFDGTRNVHHDDLVDATSDAFNTLYKKRKIRKAVVGNMF